MSRLKYTAILEFRGGTYISQVYAKSIKEAYRSWAKTLEVDGIKYLGEATKRELFIELEEYPPTLIDGTDNVWFGLGLIKTGKFRVHFVR